MSGPELTEQVNPNLPEEDSSTDTFHNDKAEIQLCRAPSRKLSDLKPKLIYNGILVGVLVLYGLAGGFVFKKFETASVGFSADGNVISSSDQGVSSTEDFLQELLTGNNGNTQPFDEKWRSSAIAKLNEFIRQKTELSSQEVPMTWGFADSWLFACTIFTTIGYGNIAPLSVKGRVFCMLFAAIGIPLFSVVAGSLVSLITDVTRALHAEYHKRKQLIASAKRKKDDSIQPELEKVPELDISLIRVAIVCSGYLCFGSLFFSLGEGWSLFESFYYCFITLSTVGLGDFVPGHVHHTVLFGVYTLVGLVLVIMLFGALEDAISNKCQKLKDKLKVVD